MNITVFVNVEIDGLLIRNGNEWQPPDEENSHVPFRNLEDRIRARLRGHMEDILRQAEVRAEKYKITAGTVERS